MHLLNNLILGLAITSHTVLATIALGQMETVGGRALLNIGWIEGINPCLKGDAYTGISASGQNPCGIHFTLSNGYTYYETNCGAGAIDIYNNDNTFNSHCKQKSWTCYLSKDFIIRQTWTCS